jgi:hypothetical protein
VGHADIENAVNQHDFAGTTIEASGKTGLPSMPAEVNASPARCATAHMPVIATQSPRYAGDRRRQDSAVQSCCPPP